MAGKGIHYGWVVAATTFLTMLATLFPAIRASRIPPAAAISKELVYAFTIG